LNYLQGNILQQPMNSPTDLVSEDLYSNANWHSRHHRSAPPVPLNLNQNLQHHLMSGASPQLPSNFTSPAATQAFVSRPLARSTARFQGLQNRPDASHLSVFTSVRNQETQRLNAEAKYYCVKPLCICKVWIEIPKEKFDISCLQLWFAQMSPPFIYAVIHYTRWRHFKIMISVNVHTVSSCLWRWGLTVLAEA
jgi:hypothetical protein